MSASIGTIAIDTKRANLALALANAKEADKLLRQAQYAVQIGQLNAHGQALDARGSMAKLLDALEREARGVWPEMEAEEEQRGGA